MSKKIQLTTNKPVFAYHHPAGFKQEVTFFVNIYSTNRNLYVGLNDAHTGERFTDITVNGGQRSEHLVRIKNTNENAGMAQFLIDNEMGTLLGSMDEEYPLFLFDPSKLAKATAYQTKN